MISKRMYLIVVLVFSERFSFSCLRSMLSIYMRDIMLYDEKESVEIYHSFMMLCYISAIVGGIMGNAIGKYETVLSYSIVYWIGTLMLLWTTVENPGAIMNFLALFSLVFISIGMGGIKSCIGIFGVDQLESDENILVNRIRVFFSTFYFSIYVGLFFGVFTAPLMGQIMSHLGYDMDTYLIRFGLSAVAMAIGIDTNFVKKWRIFVCGYGYYYFRKPEKNILPHMIKCILIALWRKSISYSKKSKKNHWLDYAGDSLSDRMTINDTKKTLHILSLYIPLSVFWSLFDQQNTTWIFQAARTRDSLFGIKFPAYMLQVVNPFLVLVSIPLMDRFVNPYLRKHKLFRHPLKRVLLGGAIAGTAFFFVGCVEMNLENHVHRIIAVPNACRYIARTQSCPPHEIQSYELNREWLLPQFILMAFGETLFTMTGLEFSYSETPASMKTVSISMWYFSVALGNLIVISINKTTVFKKQSHVFFLFTFCALVAIVISCKLSNSYEKIYGDSKTPSDAGNELKAENVDKATLLQKESYQLLL